MISMAIENNLVNVNSDLATEENKRRLRDCSGTKFLISMCVFLVSHFETKKTDKFIHTELGRVKL